LNDQLNSRKRSDLDFLIHRTKLQKFKKGDPKKSLYAIMHEIEMSEHHYARRNWEIMTELLARWIVENKKEHLELGSMGSCELFKDLPLKQHDKVYNRINRQDLFECYYEAAKTKPWDHLGEIMTEQSLGNKGLGQYLTPRPIVEFMVKMVLGDSPERIMMESWVDEQTRQYAVNYFLHFGRAPRHLPKIPTEPPKVLTYLDPCVGSGGFLLGATLAYPKAPLILFGIELGVSIYRACLVNMALFSNHPYSIMCADTLRLDTNKTGPGSKFWDLGNRWNPPDISAFKWKPSPIRADAFSLKAFTKLKKT